MKIWMNADAGSDDTKLALAKAFEERGFSVHIGRTGSNVHYEDYFGVTEDYDVYMTIYNGFCAGTVREAVSPEIREVLDKKGVRLFMVWDSRLWNEKMKPYRFGDFRGYCACRAWDDDFSKDDPCIEDVDRFLREHNTAYCVGPDVDTILEQFMAGGYFAWEMKSE